MRTRAFVLLLCLSCLILPACHKAPSADKSLLTVVREQEKDNPKWSFGNGEKCYEIGINKKEMPVFKDPDAAFAQFTKDYADALTALREQFKLPQISKEHWMGYKNLGWQLVSKDDSLIKKAAKVSKFLSYYENGFQINSHDDFA